MNVKPHLGIVAEVTVEDAQYYRCWGRTEGEVELLQPDRAC